MSIFKILILFGAYSITAMANCELYSSGYHTVAKYYDKEYIPRKHEFLPFIFNDPYYVLRTKFADSYWSQPIKREVDPKLVSFGSDSVCSGKHEVQKVVSQFSSTEYIRIKTCQKFLPPRSPQHGWGIFEKGTSKLMIPYHMSGEPFLEKGQVSQKIENAIVSFMLGKTFKATSAINLPEGSFKPVSFEHFKFNESFYSSTVKIEHASLKTFFAVFLTHKEKTWYIADSAGLDPCDEDVNLDEYHGKELGWIANMKSGWDYNGDGLPEVINFTSPDVYYFMEFGEGLWVIKLADDRINMHFEIDSQLGFFNIKK